MIIEEEKIQEASEKLLDKERIVVLTGSGISAESGIPTFRGEDGLWKKYSPEEFGTISGILFQFAKNPGKIIDFALNLIEVFNSADPNEGHKALARLEKKYKKKVTIITQNIDDLHERAGSTEVLKIHGDLYRLRCTRCGYKMKIDRDYLSDYQQKLKEILSSPLKIIKEGKKLLPKCPQCSGLMRPDVVFFGEPLPQKELALSYMAIDSADAMIIVGTSGEVYPANTLPYRAKENGALLIEVNPQRTIFSDIVDFFLMGTATEILPRLIP